LRALLATTGRSGLDDRSLDLLRGPGEAGGSADVPIFYAGDLAILNSRAVSIVGTRDVSEDGRRRASRVARELSEAGIVVVSGLAKGVDTAALSSAMKAGGQVAAVIGTPLAKAYPAENARLQEAIWQDHLLLTPFRAGADIFKSNFPKRNRVMAVLSDATVIVEASDTSGTLHQAAECQKLGRWLFIMRTVVDDQNLKWPAKFLGKPKTAILNSTADILAAIAS
jgi:DNA processing protein